MKYLRSFLRSSRTFRGLFAVVGVMAVWNLGCVGFQPLFAGMMGSAASMGMNCDAEGMLVAPAAPSHSGPSMTTGEVDPTRFVIAAAQGDHGAAGPPVSCGCQSCSAPPSALQVVTTECGAIPLAGALTPVTPLSTSRAPLVPPPQSVL
jgi:hypothetical protein